ncbi:HEAT repeat domain-containing protein [Streptomyces sp. NBC_00140]|uniref:HEAT repeat domain-containing protein n=1 Tax=Streptomyces sp. NBC_00140 TaxID=2975664 RepID=UPI00224EACFE|nr:HEAT repeat domain-containing protein [Streptomyces sp. NBC_00140]MCX5332271.1 HEAT repeat domain-containing protein [Streptomyces sp. NBC_00140]
MGREAERVAADGERAVGAAGDARAVVTGDGSSATYIENQYVQQAPTEPAEPAGSSDEEDGEALRRYARRVHECYGRLDLEVLIPMEEGEHPPVELNEVFVPPKVREDPPPVELPRDILNRLVDSGDWPGELPLEPDTLERIRQAYMERPLRDVLQVLAAPDADRVVLLGDPGAGKSTLVRRLALALAGGAPLDGLDPLGGRVPLVVELREYAAGQWRERTFEDFLDHLHTVKGMAPPRPLTERLLAEGRAIVLFDGLDELFDPAAREQVGHRIADFAGRYRSTGCRVVVTSRVIGYRRGVLENAGFGHYMIQDLSRPQIRQFATQWYEVACPHDPERADRLTRRLTEAVTHSRPVGELAGNPLLLTILAIIGRRRELPRDRHGVYRHAVAVLVAHWDEHAKHLRAPADAEALSYLGDEDRHELLRLVARRMQEGRGGLGGNHIHSDELLSTFAESLREEYELPLAQAVSAARTMVRQFRERNFILSHYGGGVYGFVHRAFLEYLAAEDIERRYTREREWNQDELVDQIFVRRAAEPAWREVLLLLVGQIGEREAGAAIDRFLALHRRRVDPGDTGQLVLALRALGEVRKIGVLARQSREVVGELIALFSEGAPKGRFPVELRTVHPVLGSFGAHWSGRRPLLRWFHLRAQFTWSVAASSALAYSLHQTRELTRVVVVHYRSAIARAEAMELLAARWAGEPDTWELLRERVTADRSAGCRRAALYLLGQHGDRAKGLWELVADRLVNDSAEEVRSRALQVLCRLWPGRAGTRRLAFEQAVADPAPEFRVLALRSVTGHFAESTAVEPLLRERAVGDPDPQVRDFALRRLVNRGSSDSTWELVRERAADDPSRAVRRTAALLLRHHAGDKSVAIEPSEPDESFTDDPDRAEDADVQLRRQGLQQLVRDRADDPATWTRVMGFLDDDPDESIRAVAVRLLGGHRGDLPGTREVVVDRCLHDPSAHVRHSALQILARQWGESPDTRDFLRQRAVLDDEVRVRCAALDMVATYWIEEPASPALLRDRALTDPEVRARVSALRWCALHEPEEAAAELARGVAVTDPHHDGRTAALWVLAFGWPADPATMPLLRARAEEDEDESVREEAARALAAAEALAPLAEQLP